MKAEGTARWSPAVLAGATTAALVVVAIVPRVGALGPSSLWQDDAWPTLVARLGSPGDISLVGATSVGWSFLLDGVLSVTGLSSTAAQAPAFVAGVLTAPVLVLLARRMGLGWAASLVAGLLVALAPAGIQASVRVKANTAGELLTVVVLLAAWSALEGDGRRRELVVVVVTAVGAVLITAEVVPVVAGVALALIAAPPADPADRNDRVLAALAVAVATAAWLAFVIADRVTERLRDDWAEGYLTTDEGVVGLFRSGAGRLVDLGQAFGGVWPVVIGLGAAGALVLVTRRKLGPAVLLLAPIALAFGAALLHLAPIGAGMQRGRVNLALHPVLALVAAVAVDAMVRRWRRVGVVAVAAIALSAVLAAPSATYPVEDLRPVVAVLDDRVADDDVVLVDPVADWATSLYTRFPVGVVPDDRSPTGFRPRVDRARWVIPEWFRGHEPPGYYDRVVAEAVAGATTVWLVRLDAGGAEALAAALEARGFRAEVIATAPGARLERWRRPAPSVIEEPPAG